jgi:hypothetical protein
LVPSARVIVVVVEPSELVVDVDDAPSRACISGSLLEPLELSLLLLVPSESLEAAT